MWGIVPFGLTALREIAARPAMTAAPPMQREAVGLPLEAVLTVTLVRRLRCDLRRRRAAGDKGRKALHVVAFVVAAFGCSMLGMSAAKALLLPRLEELRVARQVRLRIPRTEGRLLAHARQTGWFLVPVVGHVIPRLVPPVHSAFTAEEGGRLPELFLRRGDQAEIMFRVLEIILGGNWISRGLGVTRKLQVFLGNVGRGASYFDVRSVRLIYPCERIVTLAVAPAHTLVLLISHD
jgi:hypothetical protein